MRWLWHYLVQFKLWRLTTCHITQAATVLHTTEIGTLCSISTKTERVPKTMSDNQILKISPSSIRGFHVYKDWWTPTCDEILPSKPEKFRGQNTIAVLKKGRVIGHLPIHLANTKKPPWYSHFISKPTNQGSVEICGKAVNRPLALRGHVTSLLWKWKLHDFAFQKLSVGHLLNKIRVIWFFKPAPFA